MAKDLESLLAARASALAPTAKQLADASRSQQHLRQLLDSGRMQNRIVESFLIGSYARHTALRPLDDVDIVFVIDPSAWQDGYERFVNKLPDPDRVLGSFARAIGYRYEDSGVHLQNRSVGLKLYHLDIDAVPAVVHPSQAGWLRVPDRRAGSWIDSGPLAHASVATAINKRDDGRFVPLVRLLKAWNAGLPTTVVLRGFAIETLATRLFQTIALPSLHRGLVFFYDFVAWLGGHKAEAAQWTDPCDVSFGWFGPKLPDVAGTGANVLAGIESDRIKAFSAAARVMRDALFSAARARTVDGGWKYIDHRFPA
jgi:hypothetical protein